MTRAALSLIPKPKQLLRKKTFMKTSKPSQTEQEQVTTNKSKKPTRSYTSTKHSQLNQLIGKNKKLTKENKLTRVNSLVYTSTTLKTQVP